MEGDEFVSRSQAGMGNLIVIRHLMLMLDFDDESYRLESCNVMYLNLDWIEKVLSWLLMLCTKVANYIVAYLGEDFVKLPSALRLPIYLLLVCPLLDT